MKRFFAFLLVLLAVASGSFAETEVAADPHVFSGSGTKILEGFEITFPSRLIVNCDKAIKVTLYQTGYEDQPVAVDPRNSDTSYTIFIDPVSISCVMVETQGSWDLEFLPLAVSDGPGAERIGSYISDAFQVEPPVIVNISFDKQGTYGSRCSVLLHKYDENGNGSVEEVFDSYVSDHVSYDMIIKPEKNIFAYMWVIDCASDMRWSIKAK